MLYILFSTLLPVLFISNVSRWAGLQRDTLFFFSSAVYTAEVNCVPCVIHHAFKKSKINRTQLFGSCRLCNVYPRIFDTETGGFTGDKFGVNIPPKPQSLCLPRAHSVSMNNSIKSFFAPPAYVAL